MGCNPDANNPSQCQFTPLVNEGLSDADTTELPQPGQMCSLGPVTGTINGNVTVSAGQHCRFTNCHITGSVTINGGSFWSNCAVGGIITETAGSLVLAQSASVGGIAKISGESAFTIGPGVVIGGSLQIQSLAGVQQQGTVCGTRVGGILQAQNNASPLEIGGKSPTPVVPATRSSAPSNSPTIAR